MTGNIFPVNFDTRRELQKLLRDRCGEGMVHAKYALIEI